MYKKEVEEYLNKAPTISEKTKVVMVLSSEQMTKALSRYSNTYHELKITDWSYEESTDTLFLKLEGNK